MLLRFSMGKYHMAAGTNYPGGVDGDKGEQDETNSKA
jgi:hypothetical protein